MINANRVRELAQIETIPHDHRMWLVYKADDGTVYRVRLPLHVMFMEDGAKKNWHLDQLVLQLCKKISYYDKFKMARKLKL